MKYSVPIAALVTLSLYACESLLPPAPEDTQTLDGPVSGLSGAQQGQFIAGDIAFNDDVFSVSTGLGPLFVATSCGSCHAGDGKGHPFTTLTRFGQIDDTGNSFLGAGGPQLQHRALPGFVPEQIPSGATFASFLPPASTGLGFLDVVPDADLIAMADPFDSNADGISGVPNWVTPPSYSTLREGAVAQNGKYIGRFGKKGSTYDLLQQTAKAYNEDIGITSTFEPADTYTGSTIDPEVTDQTVQDVVFYLKTLKAPVERNPNDPDVLSGKEVFMSIGCANCHKPELQTGYYPIDALAYKTIYPYTDLLLHDMGPGLDDGYTEGSALTSEWRTPPLWGLGLSKISQGGQYFLLHDGRARSIEEAIRLHGGEGAASASEFSLLSEPDKLKLIRFLESL